MRLEAAVLGVSVWGPGLEGWEAARPVLSGALPHQHRPAPPPPPAILAPTERRRAGPVVRLALQVAQAAVASSGLPPASMRSVFGSSNGDGVVVGTILDALATAGAETRVVSPTQFHNSVHNAAAGYWSIASGGREPATCLGAHDDTWAASLLLAMAGLADGRPALLCCYDHPLPVPLDALRPTADPFGVGLVLAPGRGLQVEFVDMPADSAALADPGLAALMHGNCIARCLPLLAAIAAGHAGRHSIPYLDGRLEIAWTP